MKRIALCFFALLSAAPALRAGDVPACTPESLGVSPAEFDPLDCASPEDFLDLLPGQIAVPPSQSGGGSVAPPPPPVAPPPPPTGGSAGPVPPQPQARPQPQSHAGIPPASPLVASAQPQITYLASAPNILPAQYFAAPPHQILLGVYTQKSQRIPRLTRAKLVRGRQYVIEARATILDITKVGREVTFRVDARHGIESFHRDGVSVGAVIRAEWTLDPATRHYVAQAVLNAETMTTLFQADTITASCPGLSDGKLDVEVLPF